MLPVTVYNVPNLCDCYLSDVVHGHGYGATATGLVNKCLFTNLGLGLVFYSTGPASLLVQIMDS